MGKRWVVVLITMLVLASTAALAAPSGWHADSALAGLMPSQPGWSTKVDFVAGAVSLTSVAPDPASIHVDSAIYVNPLQSAQWHFGSHSMTVPEPSGVVSLICGITCLCSMIYRRRK